jgi:hypothetical protein
MRFREMTIRDSIKGGYSEMPFSPFIEDYFQRREEAWKNPSWWNLFAMWIMAPILVLLVYAWHEDREAAKRQKTAVATIVAQDHSNHGCYNFVFSVESVPYSGCDFPMQPAIGHKVLVFYDPKDPSRNHVQDFWKVSQGRLQFVPVPILFFIAGAGYIWLRRRSYRREQERCMRTTER